jgi:hypothetical protein
MLHKLPITLNNMAVPEGIKACIIASTKMEKKFIKICPKCGSTNVSIPGAGMDLKLTQDKCKDCGHIGHFPEVEESKADYFRKLLKK